MVVTDVFVSFKMNLVFAPEQACRVQSQGGVEQVTAEEVLIAVMLELKSLLRRVVRLLPLDVSNASADWPTSGVGVGNGSDPLGIEIILPVHLKLTLLELSASYNTENLIA